MVPRYRTAVFLPLLVLWVALFAVLAGPGAAAADGAALELQGKSPAVREPAGTRPTLTPEQWRRLFGTPSREHVVFRTAGGLEDYLRPEPHIPSDNPEIVDLARKLTAGLAMDTEKLWAIYAWVVDNIEYDDSLTIWDPLEVLHKRKGICAGYSYLLASLLRAAGVPCKYVAGVANGAWGWDRHAWNEVYVGGRWWSVDVTWDSCHWHYLKENQTAPAPQLHPDQLEYYLVEERPFSADHHKIMSNRLVWDYKGDEFDLELWVEEPGAIIYYTLDGSEPTTASARYTQPIHITNGTVVKAIAVVPQGVVSYLEMPFIHIPAGIQLYGVRDGQHVYFTVGQSVYAPGFLLAAEGVAVYLWRVAGGGGIGRPDKGTVVDLRRSWGRLPEGRYVFEVEKQGDPLRGEPSSVVARVYVNVLPPGFTRPAPPVASPPPGKYDAPPECSYGPGRIALLSSTAAADIYYTTDGTPPNRTSPRCGLNEKGFWVANPPLVYKDTVIRAVAVVGDWDYVSEEVEFRYDLEEFCPAPGIYLYRVRSNQAFYFTEGEPVRLPGYVASDFSITDREVAVTSPKRGLSYSWYPRDYGHILDLKEYDFSDLPPGCYEATVKIKTSGSGNEVAVLAVKVFVLPRGFEQPNTAVTSFPPPGDYLLSPNAPLQVRLSAAEGAEIRYTTDGSEPGRNSLLYSGPIEVRESTTIKAVAFLGDRASGVCTFPYAVTVAPGDPVLSVDPVKVDFGATEVGLPVRCTITLRNEGAADLILENITSPFPHEFSVDVSTCAGLRLAPGEKHEITISFCPRSIGEKTGYIFLTSNDPKKRNLNIALRGTGLPGRPPVVVRTDPENGTTGAPVNAKIVVTFNKPIEAGPNFGQIEVKGPGLGLYEVRFSGEGDKLIIELGGSLAFASVYTVYIPAGAVQDLAGNPLAQDYTFSFTTAAARKKGDVNGDGVVNVLDVVKTVNIALGRIQPTDEERYAADANGDGVINVLDVVRIVNMALGRG